MPISKKHLRVSKPPNTAGTLHCRRRAAPPRSPGRKRTSAWLAAGFKQWRTPMDLKLDNKIACVTGSSRGIGLSIARRLAEEGCRVAITGRTKADLNQALKTLQSEFGNDRIIAVPGDLSEDRNSKKLI